MRACARILDELERDLADRLGPARLAELQALLVDLGAALDAINSPAADRGPRE